MKKIMALLLSLLVASCAPSIWGHANTIDEVVVQGLMRQTVEVHVGIVYVDQSVGRPRASASLGSGFVVAYDPDRNESLVVTAGHVCRARPTVEVGEGDRKRTVPVMMQMYSVQNAEGDELKARTILVDLAHDVCIVATTGWAGRTARLSADMPPLGARLVSVGSPDGSFGKWRVDVLEGRFSGLLLFGEERALFMQTTVPACGGASGSAVYYMGAVVGLVSRANTDFPVQSWIVPGKFIVEDVRIALGLWKKGD